MRQTQYVLSLLFVLDQPNVLEGLVSDALEALLLHFHQLLLDLRVQVCVSGHYPPVYWVFYLQFGLRALFQVEKHIVCNIHPLTALVKLPAEVAQKSLHLGGKVLILLLEVLQVGEDHDHSAI